jgi:RecA/RadA recombinase
MVLDPIVIAAVEAAVEQRGSGRVINGELKFTCPDPSHHANGDAHPSARYHLTKKTWFCDVGGIGGGVRDLGNRLGLAPHNGARLQRETARWTLRDGAGAYVAEHVRLEPGRNGTPKDCVWYRHETAGLGGLKPADLPLYGVDKLIRAPAGSPVVVTEGEKACDALAARGILAVATVTGAGGTPADAVLRALHGFRVILWPDADAPGRTHMRRIADRLTALGIPCRMVMPWPENIDGKDAADFTGTTGELQAFLDAASSPKPAGDADSRVAVGVLLADVVPEPVRWLWPGRLALGKLAILEGRPDEGKTTVAVDLAARTSTGAPMPFETARRAPGGVVFLTAEDGLADTIRPRLEAAKADLTRIVAALPDELPTLDDAGLAYIKTLVRQVDAALVIIDPLMAFVPDALDTYRDHHARRLLRKLSALADETGAAVLVLRHVRKGAALNAKDAGGGSIGFTAAARVVLLAAGDPEDETRKVLARVKGNLSAPFPSLGYRLVGAGLTVRIEWLGTTSHTAEQLLVEPQDAEERTAGEEAVAFLHLLLADGPQPAKDVHRAAREVGITERTLDRAKPRAGVVARRVGGLGKDGWWSWELTAADGGEETPPSKDATDPLRTPPKNMASLGEDGVLSDAGDGPEGKAGSDDAARVFETDAWQTCLRCGGRRWWHDGVAGDRCVACHPIRDRGVSDAAAE